jgi:hypothetical protein
MAVGKFSAGRQMPAKPVFRLGAEAGDGLEDFYGKLAIAKCVASAVGLARRAAAQFFDYLIFADGLHLRIALPDSNAPV